MKRVLVAAALALASTVAFAAPLTYKIDANHTDVVASWSHFGFSNPIAHFGKVDAAFFAGTSVRSSILVNLGQGDPASIFPRSPRLGFDEACQIL